MDNTRPIILPSRTTAVELEWKQGSLSKFVAFFMIDGFIFSTQGMVGAMQDAGFGAFWDNDKEGCISRKMVDRSVDPLLAGLLEGGFWDGTIAQGVLQDGHRPSDEGP
jgi:hypothetical protein